MHPVSVWKLEVGDCLYSDPSEDEEGAAVEVIDCSQPHFGEDYAHFDLADTPTYPGDDEVDTAGEDGCIARFDDFADLDFDDSDVDFIYSTPTEDTWPDGDREVICIIDDPGDDQITGTLQGAGR